MPEILTIKPSQRILASPRVAAYARASMETDMLMHSLAAQVSYYIDLINKRPDWIYAGVYVDRGISGTSAEKRPDFQRLMADCDAGKIDIILVKSVSRFARNKIDALKAIRHLKALGISVRFEREGVDTLTQEGELLLTLLATFAEEEAKSISKNVKWAIHKKYDQGIEFVKKRMLGYRWEDGRRVIVPDEAEEVRWLFNRYNEGDISIKHLAQEFNEKGFRSINKNRMSPSSLKHILTNEVYSGDVILQKRYMESIGKARVNRGERDRMLLQEAHDPIIGYDTFEKTKEVMAKRAALSTSLNAKKTCFSGKIRCGLCGSSVVRRTRPKGPFAKIWGCNTKDRKGKGACSLHFISEDDLIEVSKEALGQKDFDEDIFKRRVESVTLFDGKIVFTFRNGSVKTIKRTDIRHSPLSGKVICGSCGEKMYRENQKGDYDAIWRCSGKKKTGNCRMKSSIKDKDLMKAATQVLGLKHSDDNEIRAKVESVKVCEKSFIFILKNGEKIRWLRE